MQEIVIFDAVNKPNPLYKRKIVQFLFEQLGEYGDSKEDILKAIDYSIKEYGSFGGFTMVLTEKDIIVGAVVLNRTGMSGYIPENILVYIATHIDFRGKGLGKLLMKEAIDYAKGDIALHVEAENPARFLYEKIGFESPYIEMRLKK